jgi:hypothetical protein
MALYIPHSIFHLARLLYVRPETFKPYYVGGKISLKRFLGGAHTKEIGFQQLVSCNVKLQFHEFNDLVPNIERAKMSEPSIKEETLAA